MLKKPKQIIEESNITIKKKYYNIINNLFTTVHKQMGVLGTWRKHKPGV